jgi:hypothetical protein
MPACLQASYLRARFPGILAAARDTMQGARGSARDAPAPAADDETKAAAELRAALAVVAAAQGRDPAQFLATHVYK